MALKYTSYTATPYAGNYVGQQIGICQQSNVSPRVVMVEIDWSKYTSGFVSCSLIGASPGMTLDVIKSVYIDNIGLVLPITVVFPDTQCEVTCQANAEMVQPVLTGNLLFNIVLGSTSLSLSSLKQATTRVYLSNVDLRPFLNVQTPQSVNYFESSNNPGTAQAFIPKPIGEQHAIFQLNLNSGVVTDWIHSGKICTGDIFQYYNLASNGASYLVITDILVTLQQAYFDRASGGATDFLVNISLYKLASPINFTIRQWLTSIGVGLENYQYKILQDSHGLYVPVNPYGPMNLALSVTPASANLSGYCNIDCNFTYISPV